MSKSLGNGIDPLEIIEQYGADALRMTLITGNAPGNDMRFYNERVEASRNFANKVWNASRFIMMNIEDKEITEPTDFKLRPADRWIMSKCNNLVKDVTENMDKFELGIALAKIYDFMSVSYTHLDVYKRQPLASTVPVCASSATRCMTTSPPTVRTTSFFILSPLKDCWEIPSSSGLMTSLSPPENMLEEDTFPVPEVAVIL